MFLTPNIILRHRNPQNAHPWANPRSESSSTRFCCRRRQEKTRELSYRKDDRSMRPMYGCPENFRESLTTLTATFPEIGAFVPSEHINVHAKLEVRR